MTNLVRKFNNRQEKQYNNFVKKYKSYEILDLYEDLNLQYKLLNNPKIYFSSEGVINKFKKNIISELHKKQSFALGSWVAIPFQRKIYHLLDLDEFLDYRTIRNRNLINRKEQELVYKKKVLFVGMSVGSQVLINFIRTGIGNDVTLVDADNIELHNMNRTTYLMQHAGKKKVNVMRDMVVSIDPYLNVEAVDKHLNDSNIEKLVKGMDLIVDSFDDFGTKIKLRKLAKEYRIPVLSGFDVSRGAMVISERYDVEKDLKLSFYLNGYKEEDILSARNMNASEKTELFIKIIGEKYHDSRMLESVKSVGKTLTGYPQLSIATSLASSLWTTTALDILLDRVRKSVRVYINLEKAIYENKIN